MTTISVIEAILTKIFKYSICPISMPNCALTLKHALRAKNMIPRCSIMPLEHGKLEIELAWGFNSAIGIHN